MYMAGIKNISIESRSDMVRYACIAALLGILGEEMMQPFVMSVIPNLSMCLGGE